VGGMLSMDGRGVRGRDLEVGYWSCWIPDFEFMGDGVGWE